MATVSPTGLSPTTLSGYLDRMEDVLRTALGSDINLSPETPQGQMVGLLALVFTEAEEALAHVAAGLNREQAAATQLDDYGTLLRIVRVPGRRSTVTATLSGTPGVTVPAGSRARAGDAAEFELVSDALIGASGSVDAPMQSTVEGPIVAAAGTLTTLVTPIAGWTGVTNTAAAAPGNAPETDADYRARYARAVTTYARDTPTAMEARLRGLTGVAGARVVDNATTSALTIPSVTLPARSVLAIVDGGDRTEIFEAISATKPVGIPMAAPTGAITSGRLAYLTVTRVPIAVSLTTTVADAFPATGVQEIRARLAGWVAGTWASADGDFDTAGLGIGDSLDERRLLSPISSVPGHTIFTISVAQADGSVLPAEIDLNERLTLAESDISVTLI